jgi:hypothetical protein
MVISKAIIAAPVVTEADIANKFRFAANFIEYPHGLMADEPRAVFGPLADLARFRNNEWPKEFGRPAVGTGVRRLTFRPGSSADRAPTF